MRIALCQSDIVWEQAARTIEMLDEPVHRFCAKYSPDVLVLPETYSVGFTMNESVAEKEDGVSASWLRKTAAETGVALVASIPIEENPRRYNRCHFVTPDGKEYHYDKHHLFNYSGEGKAYTPGDKVCLVDYRGWRFNINICYDLRFPVWSRNTGLDYDVMLYMANWPVVRIEAAKALSKARAIENCCYCLFCNRVGEDPSCKYNGQSMIYNFYGEKVAQRRKLSGVEFMFADLDRDAIDSYHTKFPARIDADRFDIKR